MTTTPSLAPQGQSLPDQDETGTRDGGQRLAPCPSRGAYMRHLRHGEVPCDACKAFHAEQMRAYQGRRRRAAGVPTRSPFYRLAGEERDRVARELAARYDAGATIAELAASLGCSVQFATGLLAEAGVKKRTRAEATTLWWCTRKRAAQVAADSATESVVAE